MNGARASRWGTWLAGSYLVLVVASAAYLAYRLAPVAGESGVVGWLGLLAGVGLNAAALG